MIATEKLRGWIRASRRAPARMQRKMLREAGCDAIYDADEQSIDALVKALRRGDVVVVTTVARLARQRVDLRKIVDAIRAKGAVVMETTTGRRSDNIEHCASMMLDAVDEIASDGRGLPSAAAKQYGEKGREARREKLEASRMSRHDAQREWFDVRHQSTGDALVAMPGWTLQAAYRAFGARGVSVGRPRKGKG